jgi:hypothetical protein
MNIVIELDSNILVDKSKQVWESISKIPLDCHGGVSILEDYIQEQTDIPWLSGKVGCITFEPNSKCPIHCDDHEGVSYRRSLNILVDSDGDNHSTRYYKWEHGIWDPKEYQALFDKDLSELTQIFEFTVTKPTVFYNQILHDVYNYGNKKRIIIMWLIESSVTDNDILAWCEQHNVKYKIIYETE